MFMHLLLCLGLKFDLRTWIDVGIRIDKGTVHHQLKFIGNCTLEIFERSSLARKATEVLSAFFIFGFSIARFCFNHSDLFF